MNTPFTTATPRRLEQALPSLLAGAALLGACAWFVRHKTHQAEQRFPPRGRFIDVQGVRLHYLDQGPADAAQTVVLLHGNGAMAEEMNLSGLAALCAERHRVLVFDRPGFGYSERPKGRPWGPAEQADLLHDALRALKVERPIVLGHSWGSLVALAMGLRHARSVGGLVLVSGYYFPTPRLDTLLSSPPAIPVIGALLRHTVSPLIGRLIWPLAMRRLFSPLRTSEAFARDYPVWMSLRPSQLLASASESAQMPWAAASLRPLHRQLKLPVVLVAGVQDRMNSASWHSGRLHDELDQSWLRMIEGAGHMVHHAAPGQVAAAVEQVALWAAERAAPKVQPPADWLGAEPAKPAAPMAAAGP